MAVDEVRNWKVFDRKRMWPIQFITPEFALRDEEKQREIWGELASRPRFERSTSKMMFRSCCHSSLLGNYM
jgi:hypothetical protein